MVSEVPEQEIIRLGQCLRENPVYIICYYSSLGLCLWVLLEAVNG